MTIDHVHLRRLDLNLLLAFDALMETRSVSAAARRLGVGQSAMSHALGRLRALFDDPPPVHDDYAVGVSHRRQPMGDDQRGTVLQQLS